MSRTAGGAWPRDPVSRPRGARPGYVPVPGPFRAAPSAPCPAATAAGHGAVSLLPGGLGLRLGLAEGTARLLLVPVPPDEPVHWYPPGDVPQAGAERHGQ